MIVSQREEAENLPRALLQTGADADMSEQTDTSVMAGSRSRLRCNECGNNVQGQKSLATRISSVDWTADELRLNGVCPEGNLEQYRVGAQYTHQDSCSQFWACLYVFSCV